MMQQQESRQQRQQARGRGGFGGRRPDRWVPVISVSGAVMGGRPGSRVEMGRGIVEVGRRGVKWPETPFSN
jgi:hypothetical protein